MIFLIQLIFSKLLSSKEVYLNILLILSIAILVPILPQWLGCALFTLTHAGCMIALYSFEKVNKISNKP